MPQTHTFSFLFFLFSWLKLDPVFHENLDRCTSKYQLLILAAGTGVRSEFLETGEMLTQIWCDQASHQSWSSSCSKTMAQQSCSPSFHSGVKSGPSHFATTEIRATHLAMTPTSLLPVEPQSDLAELKPISKPSCRQLFWEGNVDKTAIQFYFAWSPSDFYLAFNCQHSGILGISQKCLYMLADIKLQKTELCENNSQSSSPYSLTVKRTDWLRGCPASWKSSAWFPSKISFCLYIPNPDCTGDGNRWSSVGAEIVLTRLVVLTGSLQILHALALCTKVLSFLTYSSFLSFLILDFVWYRSLSCGHIHLIPKVYPYANRGGALKPAPAIFVPLVPLLLLFCMQIRLG